MDFLNVYIQYFGVKLRFAVISIKRWFPNIKKYNAFLASFHSNNSFYYYYFIF